MKCGVGFHIDTWKANALSNMIIKFGNHYGGGSEIENFPESWHLPYIQHFFRCWVIVRNPGACFLRLNWPRFIMSSHFVFLSSVLSDNLDVCTIILCSINILGRLSIFMLSSRCFESIFLHAVTILGAVSLPFMCTITIIYDFSFSMRAVFLPYIELSARNHHRRINFPPRLRFQHYHLHVVPSILSSLSWIHGNET